MQVKRDITGGIMSLGVIITSIFAIMHSNLTEVYMNEVTIVENGERNTITTEAETVFGLITNGYMQFGNFDEVDVEIDDVVYDGMEIEIMRANPVIVNDGGTRFYTMTRSTDVFEVLDKHDIELGDDDLLDIVITTTNALGEEVQINPTALADFAGNVVEVEVTRVHFEVESSYEEYTLETEYVYTDDLLEGEREESVEGSPRIEETVIESEYRNGEFYAVVSEETNIVDEGVSRVVEIGTYVPEPEPETEPETTPTTAPTEPTPAPTQASTQPPATEPTPAPTPAPTQPSATAPTPAPTQPTPAPTQPTTAPPANNTSNTSIETFTASVTAYLATCQGCSGITANGTDVRSTITFNDSTFGNVRIVAACRRFPFGTVIYISGIGNAVVLDRGGAVTGNVLDLLMGANDDPWRFGRQALQAQVIRLGW